ncbi:RNA repair domain-containing protein [Streptomyces tsukubensis]|uniref:RNA repair domain-containing protein n=1 Tax=Streptomyces tsukubensis TaxID=83656 RepID=UPI0036C25EF5
MRTSEQIYHRLRWDTRFDPARFVVGIAQRGTGPKRTPLTSFVPGGDVPWHRILYFEADGERVWDRASGADLLDGTDAGRARVPRRLLLPLFEPVTVTGPPAAVPVARSGLRVLTWNTLWDRYDAERIATARRRPLLVAALRAADADVIALQEVERPLYELLRDGGWAIAPGCREASAYGLVLLSRLPVHEAARHVLGMHKALLAMVVETADGPVTVATTHLTSDHSPGAAARRRAELGAVSEALAAVPGDVVLAGDFNDVTALPADALAMRDAWPEARARDGGDPDAPTFDPRVNPLAAVGSLTGLPGRIDRVLLRGSHRTARAVLTGTVPDSGGLYPSDHFGVLASLESPRSTADGSVNRAASDHPFA